MVRDGWEMAWRSVTGSGMEFAWAQGGEAQKGFKEEVILKLCLYSPI